MTTYTTPTPKKTKTSALQKLVLICLANGPQAFAELITSTEASPSYLTVLLTKMTEAGLITRTGGRSEGTLPTYTLNQ